jgi:cytosine permease
MKKSLGIERKAMSRIPESERQNWYSIAFIWIGIMICVPALMVSGALAGSMTFNNVVLASFIGYGVVTIIMCLMSSISSDLGIPAAMAVSKGFGDRGSSYVTSIIFFIGCIGWFAYQTSACAAAFSMGMSLVGIPNFPIWLGTVIWGTLMVASSVTGFKWIKWINYITVPFLVIVCAYGGWYGLNQVGGFDVIMNHVPTTETPLTEAISVCIGMMAVGAVISGDYSRYSKNRIHTVAASVGGVLPVAVFLFAIGAIMAISVQESDIVMIFAGLGFPVFSMIVLIISTWTTNTGNAYMAGLAAMKITGLKDELRPKVTLIVGAISIVVSASGLASAIISFVSFISAITPSVAGVVIADYWIIGKGKPENWHRVKGFNWIGIISWLIGSIVAVFFSFFSPGLDSIITSIIAYLILYAILGKTSLVGQGRMPLPGEEEGSEEQ